MLFESYRTILRQWLVPAHFGDEGWFVASLILALADGKSYTAIEGELNTSRPTIVRWKTRFEEKAADIIGLYMDPPQHAAVFCVDEKTAMQGAGPTGSGPPTFTKRAEKHGFEYFRHGTLSLYAALDVKKDKFTAKPADGTPANTF